MATLASVVLQGAMIRLSMIHDNPVLTAVKVDDMKALQLVKNGILSYLAGFTRK